MLLKLAKHVGHERRHLASLLGLEQPQIDQIEQKHGDDPHLVNLAMLKVKQYMITSLYIDIRQPYNIIQALLPFCM